jgi:hypothetical protein
MKMPETRKPQIKVIDRMEEKGSVEYVLELPRNGSNNAPETGPDIQTVVTGFAELDDGTLLELVEAPADANNTLFAVWKEGKVEYTDGLNQGGRVLKPSPRTNGTSKTCATSEGCEPLSSAQTLLDALESLISRCVAIHPKYIQVLADFALTTRFVDWLAVAPYLAVVGLPQSGKTTLLKLLSLVCRRSLLVSDVSPASLYKACAQFSPTILIDEAGTLSNDRVVRHLLRSGTTRDAISVKGNQIFHCYGAKVISWLEPPNDPALNGRCVLVPMFETTRSGLAKPTDPEVQELVSTLQLLQFRFENYKKLRVGALRPRTRDILHALSAAHPEDNKRTQELLDLLKSGEAIPQDSLSTEQNAVLRALFERRELFPATRG